MAGPGDRNVKRSQLGNRVQRGVWKKARGYKHPWYGALCAKANRINKMAGGVVRVEARLDNNTQAMLRVCTKTNDQIAMLDGMGMGQRTRTVRA